MLAPLLTVALALAAQEDPEPQRDRVSDVEVPPERSSEIEGEAPPPSAGPTARPRPKPQPPARRRPPPAPRPPPRTTGPVEIPVDFGIGPILLAPNPGRMFDDQPLHLGLTLSIAAVIDKDLIRREAHRIPKQWRGAARGLEEVRYRPWFLALVPELLVISPQVLNTGMYGAVWRPVGIGVTLFDEPVNVSVNAGLDAAFILIHSNTLGVTPFLRPGVNLELVVEIPLSKQVLISTGWSSDLFVPQPIGRPPWEIDPIGDSLWHLGGPFLKLHIRWPYSVSL